MTSGGRTWAGRFFIAVGVIVLLIVVAVCLWGSITSRHIDVPLPVIAIGMIFGFVGFFMENPRDAKDGGQFIVDNVVKLAGAVRLGRRKTDPVGIPVQPAPVAPPPPEPSPTKPSDHAG
jgi:hypothetical protein